MAEALKDFLDVVAKEGLSLYKQEEVLRKAAEEETARCRQKYYEEGVRHGRQLLAQLNSGEITIDQFNNVPKKYSDKV